MPPVENNYQLNDVSGGNGLCAINVATNNNGGEIFYTYKDHLGSILALTDDNGTVISEQSFDAWGRYRDPDTWETYNSDPSEGGVFASNAIDMPVWFSRGYTGHEHLPHFDLINMNGRLYCLSRSSYGNPIPARMLSADNFVQAPGATQSYNRYAYVFNNPLKYVDPDGENPLIALGVAAANMLASYFINAGINQEWNPNKWTSGSITFGTYLNSNDQLLAAAFSKHPGDTLRAIAEMILFASNSEQPCIGDTSVQNTASLEIGIELLGVQSGKDPSHCIDRRDAIVELTVLLQPLLLTFSENMDGLPLVTPA